MSSVLKTFTVENLHNCYKALALVTPSINNHRHIKTCELSYRNYCPGIVLTLLLGKINQHFPINQNEVHLSHASMLN